MYNVKLINISHIFLYKTISGWKTRGVLHEPGIGNLFQVRLFRRSSRLFSGDLVLHECLLCGRQVTGRLQAPDSTNTLSFRESLKRSGVGDYINDGSDKNNEEKGK